MFNLYTYEKLLQEKEKTEKSNHFYLKKFRQKRTDRLAEGYKKRINEFVIDMAKHPITLKDENIRIDNPRQCFMHDNNKSTDPWMLNRPVFTYGTYISEKKRIEALMEQKKEEMKWEEKVAKEKLQSKMHQRFMNLSMSDGFFNSRWIEKNKNKNKGTKHKKTWNNSLGWDESFNNDKNKKKYFKAAVEWSEWNKTKTNRQSNNISASPCHNAIKITNNKEMFNFKGNKSMSSTASMFFKNNNNNKTHKQSISLTKSNYSINPNSNPFKLVEQFPNKYPWNADNLDIIKSNPLIYNLHYVSHFEDYQSPKRNSWTDTSRQNDQEEYDRKMKYLKKIALKNAIPQDDSPNKVLSYLKRLKKGRRKEFSNLVNPIAYFKNIYTRDDNDIDSKDEDDFIDKDGQLYLWGWGYVSVNQTDIIAKYIWNKTNYIKKKSKFNNTALKCKKNEKK